MDSIILSCVQMYEQTISSYCCSCMAEEFLVFVISLCVVVESGLGHCDIYTDLVTLV